MKYEYDLQTHANLSDEDYPIKIVVSKAKKAGLKGIVITDYNVVAKMTKKIQEAKKAELITLMGVEISTKFMVIEAILSKHSIPENEKF